MARKELTQEELNIHKDALASSVRKDFLTKDVSYQSASEIKYLAGYRRENDSTLSEVRQILREKFNASMVAVGNGQVAIVKRPNENWTRVNKQYQMADAV